MFFFEVDFLMKKGKEIIDGDFGVLGEIWEIRVIDIPDYPEIPEFPVPPEGVYSRPRGRSSGCH